VEQIPSDADGVLNDTVEGDVVLLWLDGIKWGAAPRQVMLNIEQDRLPDEIKAVSQHSGAQYYHPKNLPIKYVQRAADVPHIVQPKKQPFDVDTLVDLFKRVAQL
jgi:hypothetical protein